MKRILACSIGVLLMAGVASADYTAPTFSLDDVPDLDIGGVGTDLNGGSIPADMYTGYSVTFDWGDPQGNPWSNEALFALTDASTIAGSSIFYADPGTSMPGSASDSTPTTITQSGYFDVYYQGGDPLYFLAAQSYTGSTADWSNIQIELTTTVPAAPAATGVGVPSDTAGTMGDGAIDWYSFTLTGNTAIDINTLASTDLDDTELGLYDSIGQLLASNDDEDGGSYLSQILANLSAGTYYVAVGGYNSTFGGAFDAIGGSATGDYTLTITPEPASLVLLALGGLTVLRRRR